MSDAQDDDIEASRAPLLDHLIELRQRLFVCVMALAAGFVLCFALSTQIYTLLLHPYEVAAQILAAQKLAEAQGPHIGFVDGILQFLHLQPTPPNHKAKGLSAFPHSLADPVLHGGGAGLFFDSALRPLVFIEPADHGNGGDFRRIAA